MLNGTYTNYGRACRVRLAPHAMERMLAVETTVGLYPNPTQGDLVYLTLDDLQDEQQRIEIDLFDAMGKQVYHHAFGNDGPTVNTTLDLGGELAKGAYSMRISVNGAVRSERLMVQ
jgi:hypothetical protein